MVHIIADKLYRKSLLQGRPILIIDFNNMALLSKSLPMVDVSGVYDPNSN